SAGSCHRLPEGCSEGLISRPTSISAMPASVGTCKATAAALRFFAGYVGEDSMRPRFCLLLPIIGMMSACGPEQAASQSAPAQPSTSCKNVDFAEALALCTTLIQSGKVSGLLLAAAFNDRGDAYIKNSDFDHAIEDYDHAIELVPEYALAFGGRALAYAGKFEYERAIEDYNQAVFLDRNF